MLYMVCYDIVSNKRRKKLADVLLDYGARVQKSAFECDLKSEAALQDLLRRAKPLIDAKKDTLRIYRICGSCSQAQKSVGLNRIQPLPKTIIL